MAGMNKITFRKIHASDNTAIANIIKSVMPEFGANGPGFAIHDPEVEIMFDAYQLPRSAYFVCEVNRKVVGGGGIAPLAGGENSICELKKMYFLPEVRGQGLGKQMLIVCLREAKSLGFRKCYLESFHTMTSAIKLYESNNFKAIPSSLGNTGHYGCDRFFLLELDNLFS
jgi:putative acetyltransferase